MRDLIHNRIVVGGQLLWTATSRLEPKGYDRKHWWHGQLEVFRTLYPARKALRQLELTIDQLLIGLASMHPQGQPQFQGVHASRPLRADTGVVWQLRAGGF